MSKLNVSRKEPYAGVQAWYTYCPVYHAGNVDGDWAGLNRNSEGGRGGDYRGSSRHSRCHEPPLKHT